MTALRVLIAASAFLSCVRSVPSGGSGDLAGLEARLTSGASLRLAVEGEVDGSPAEVALDVASPLTTVSTGCFDELPRSGVTVRAPTPRGALESVPEVSLKGARIGQARLPELQAGLVEQKERCVVVLGSDALLPYAIHVDPARRELSLTRSSDGASYARLASSPEVQAVDEVLVLSLTKDPRGDWPMLVLRLRQGDAALTGPFILSTREPHSSLSAAAARSAGLKAGVELLEGLELPEGVTLPKELAGSGFTLDELELSPGVGLRHAVLRAERDWRNEAAFGVLGADVWGRFHATIDLAAGVLMLRRPRLEVVGKQQRCGRGGPGTHADEACFTLHSFPEEDGATAVGAVWRDLPEGGQFHLEPLDERGAPVSSECRIGLSFARGDRGVSTQHRFPWAGLERALAPCAGTLRRARSLVPTLFEEGTLQECPGQCAFVQHLPSGRLVCECQPQSGLSESERKFLELYRQLLQRGAPESPEPEEPE